MWKQKQVFVALVMLLFLGSAAGAKLVRPLRAAATKLMDSLDKVPRQSIISDGAKRTFIVHVPPSYSGEQPIPLVLAFHGGYGSGSHMQKVTRFDELADREDFIVVYPDGLNRHWNDGRGDVRHGQQTREHRFSHADDIKFVRDLLDQFDHQYVIDKKRIYATGISNGGMFSYRVAAELSDKFAAVAPVAGCIGEALASNFAPAEPVSVLHIHGTADKYVPYQGGPLLGGRLPGKVLPVRESVEMWVSADQCDTTPLTTELPASSDRDLCRVQVQAYKNGKSGTEVQLYRIEDGGHTWPNMQMKSNFVLGNVCRDFDGSGQIWEFFRTHPKI